MTPFTHKDHFYRGCIPLLAWILLWQSVKWVWVNRFIAWSNKPPNVENLFCSSSSKPFCMEFISEEVLLKLKNFRFKCEASIFFDKKHWVGQKCFFVTNWVCFKHRQENSVLNIVCLQYCMQLAKYLEMNTSLE